LLMPKLGVQRAFNIHKWEPSSLSPLQAYYLAGFFGVGYSTFLLHINRTLNLLPESTSKSLECKRPLEIRSSILGEECSRNLHIVDNLWTSRSIDIEIGDFVLAPQESIHEGKCLEHVDMIKCGSLFRGVSQGVGRISVGEEKWCGFVRISKKQFVGRNIYRYLDDSQSDDVS
jgi:hypothetical protein